MRRNFPLWEILFVNDGSKDNIKKAMRWEKWNVWAKWYEFFSTHPLISKRLEAIRIKLIPKNLYLLKSELFYKSNYKIYMQAFLLHLR